MEFYDYYFKLFEDAHHKMTRALKLKLKSIKVCRKESKENKKKGKGHHSDYDEQQS